MVAAVGCGDAYMGDAVGAPVTLVGGSRKSDDTVGVGMFGGTAVGCGLSDVHPDKSRPTLMERTHTFVECSVRFAIGVMPPLVYRLIEQLWREYQPRSHL